MLNRVVVRSRAALLFVVLLLSAGGIPVAAEGSQGAAQESQGYAVVARWPHDSNAFTQGLAFRGAALFEGTGLNGKSTLRRVDLATGKVLRRVKLDDKHFGEGITVLGNRVFQLTWTSGLAFVYEATTFKRIRRFRYRGEGWGLTTDGRRLIMSDGTSVLRFRNPRTFATTGKVQVTDEGRPVQRLNELEWVNGEVFANVWPSDEVVRINPRTGRVTGRLDLRALRALEAANGNPDVTNGIAYLRSQNRLFVTGKWWSHLYEIRLTG